MALVLGYSRKVRQALTSPSGFGSDLLLLCAIAGLIAAVAVIFGQAASPAKARVVIDLSLWALPKYTLLSLGRGVAAYMLSLIVTLIYGTVAAHDRRAESVLMPAMDVFQALPMLAFLPGLVLMMVRLFPSRELGLEIACVVMIFTNQVPNMVFSYHGSVRGIPTILRDAAVIHQLGRWKTFTLLEVPASMIGLVWNSMMSMAGGWFFLTVSEAFTLNGHDYRLPGLGSYMSEAIDAGNHAAIVGALLAMVVMIVAVDQLLWRPIVVWSQRFRFDDSAGADLRDSWFVRLFRRSRLLKTTREFFQYWRHALLTRPNLRAKPRVTAANRSSGRPIVMWIAFALLGGLAAWGAERLMGLLLSLPLRDPAPNRPWDARQDWITVLAALLASFARTTAAVVLSASWTLPAGIAIGLSRRWSARLQPVIQVLASFPAPMLYPLVILALVGLKVSFSVGCVALMLLGAQWYILFNVIAGASAIPDELKDAAVMNCMPRTQRWRRLYLPSVFPYLVTGLITAAGGAWNASIIAEYMTVGSKPYIAFGLGSKISQATANGHYPMLAACVVTMGLFVVSINRVFWKRLYRLAESRYSLNV